MRRGVTVAAFGVLTVVLAACDSSGRSGTSSPPASAAGSSADASIVAAVTKAYETFFAPDSTDQQIADSVQNGETLVVPAQAQDQSKYQGKSGVTLSSVTMQSPIVAKVIFTVTIDGSPMLPNASGYAVRDAGSWKMAATTFCDLVMLEDMKTAPKACSDPAQTAFPTP